MTTYLTPLASLLFAFQLAIEHGVKFLETSAKASINVEEGFFTLARDIKAKMDRKLVSTARDLSENRPRFDFF